MTPPPYDNPPPDGAGAASSRTVLRVHGAKTELVRDTVITETHLRITAGHELLAVLACSPVDLEDLVVGFLFGQGLIDGRHDLSGLGLFADPDQAAGRGYAAVVSFRDPDRQARAAAHLAAMRFVASGCGSPPRTGAGDAAQAAGAPRTSAGAGLQPRTIAGLARAIQNSSPLFQSTGGVHAAALSGPLGSPIKDLPELILVREDIGRHNAVDKVAGHCLGRGIPLGDKALLVTGRVSVEIVSKAERMGCPVVLSRSAPTDFAVEYADTAGITLIGFARGERANVYSNWWRLAPEDGPPEG